MDEADIIAGVAEGEGLPAGDKGKEEDGECDARLGGGEPPRGGLTLT